MNRALTYLYFCLLKRRMQEVCLSLRRPTKLIAFAALACFLAFLFHYRDRPELARLVRPECLVGGALVMLGGSLFKGFMQRGLVFDPPDVEFLFTGPFTQNQVVLYRLLPNYLFALAQGLVFLALFAPHLKHPAACAACLILFQIACFHIAAGAAIYAGGISDRLHHRIRCMMLAAYFVLTGVYFRAAWDIPIVPGFVAAPLAQLLFYPAVTLSDVATAPPARQWSLALTASPSFWTRESWGLALYLAVFAAGALATLAQLLKLKAGVFETSLSATTRVAENRRRLEQGRPLAAVEPHQPVSMGLPQTRLFGGGGAIVWKNLVAARRSRREIVLALAFTTIYTAFLVGLRWAMHRLGSQGGELGEQQLRDFDLSLFSLMVALPFFLQRTFPFDFRRDGHHLLSFRTLPVSAFALVLAEIAVPTLCCLAFQSVGVAVLMCFARFDWIVIVLVLLAFPAIVLAVNCVWNLHYLLSAAKRAGGGAHSDTAVGTLMTVVLSFLVFFPAGWAGPEIGRHIKGPFGDAAGLATALAVQYGVDFLLLLALAELFQRSNLSRDS
jgi:hypothetical protein